MTTSTDEAAPPEHRLSTLADLPVRVEKEGHESRDMAWGLRGEEKYTDASYHIGCAHTSFRVAALLKALIAKVEGDSLSRNQPCGEASADAEVFAGLDAGGPAS